MGFPVQKFITWQPSPEEAEVVRYHVAVNGVVIAQPVPPATSVPYEVPAEATYTAAVRAENVFGVGEPGEAVLVAALPPRMQSVTWS